MKIMNVGYNILVYHVNSFDKVDAVIKSFNSGKNQLYVSEEDGYWAGSGMYFWDNRGNVAYWKKDRERKNIETSVLSATLSLDEENVLDLTDEDMVNSYNRMWPFIAKKFNVEKDCSPGKKLNYICKFIPKIKVVKLIGYYPTKVENKFFSTREELPHMTTTAKTIFCVKNGDRLTNVNLVEPD